MTPLVAPAEWRDERIWSTADPSATALGKALGRALGKALRKETGPGETG